jgi:hypothetical protein
MAVVVVLLLLMGCEYESTPRPVGERCDEAECEPGLICVYGRCRSECAFDRDCPGGGCIAVPSGGDERICTLPEEEDCTERECPDGFACGVDGLCREMCGETHECVAGYLCVQTVCLDESLAHEICDVDDDGFLDQSCGGMDCDDGDPEVSPDAAEVCDEVDNDCDADLWEENAIGCVARFEDADRDTYGSGTSRCLCPDTPAERLGLYTADNSADCDDGDPYVWPGQIEICNDIDDNCDGRTDEGCP